MQDFSIVQEALLVSQDLTNPESCTCAAEEHVLHGLTIYSIRSAQIRLPAGPRLSEELCRSCKHYMVWDRLLSSLEHLIANVCAVGTKPLKEGHLTRHEDTFCINTCLICIFVRSLLYTNISRQSAAAHRNDFDKRLSAEERRERIVMYTQPSVVVVLLLLKHSTNDMAR